MGSANGEPGYGGGYGGRGYGAFEPPGINGGVGGRPTTSGPSGVPGWGNEWKQPAPAVAGPSGVPGWGNEWKPQNLSPDVIRQTAERQNGKVQNGMGAFSGLLSALRQQGVGPGSVPIMGSGTPWNQATGQWGQVPQQQPGTFGPNGGQGQWDTSQGYPQRYNPQTGGYGGFPMYGPGGQQGGGQPK